MSAIITLLTTLAGLTGDALTRSAVGPAAKQLRAAGFGAVADTLLNAGGARARAMALAQALEAVRGVDYDLYDHRELERNYRELESDGGSTSTPANGERILVRELTNGVMIQGASTKTGNVVVQSDGYHVNFWGDEATRILSGDDTVVVLHDEGSYTFEANWTSICHLPSLCDGADFEWACDFINELACSGDLDTMRQAAWRWKARFPQHDVVLYRRGCIDSNCGCKLDPDHDSRWVVEHIGSKDPSTGLLRGEISFDYGLVCQGCGKKGLSEVHVPGDLCGTCYNDSRP